MEKGAIGFFDLIAGTRMQVQESIEHRLVGTLFVFPA
jgi:hypothetical protein